MEDLFTGDLVFVQPRCATRFDALRAELLAWWSGSPFVDVAVVVRAAEVGVVLLDHNEPRLVAIDAWLRSRAWGRVVVRRTTTRALPYYAPHLVRDAMRGVDVDAASTPPAARSSDGLGFLPTWFQATGAAAGPFTPRALGSDADATDWAESGLYEPEARLPLQDLGD